VCQRHQVKRNVCSTKIKSELPASDSHRGHSTEISERDVINKHEENSHTHTHTHTINDFCRMIVRDIVVTAYARAHMVVQGARAAENLT
jgi:hypothetical protein